MVIAVISVVIFLLFFPLRINLNLCFSGENSRLYFAVFLFQKLKVLSGYIKERENGGIYVHLKNKAIIVDKDALTSLSGSGGFNSVISLTDYNLILYTGVESASLCFCYSVVSKVLLIITNVLYIKGNSNVVITNVLSGFISIFLQINGWFNLFCIVKSVIANYISKGVNYVKRKTI